MTAVELTLPYATIPVCAAGPERACAELISVTKQYTSTRALDGLNLALHPGEIVALLGPNGAGKSTTVRLLLGLTAPTSGTVRIFGRDPRDPRTRTRIGAMLQVGNAPEMLRVREHLDLFRSYYPAPLPVEELVRIARLESILQKQFGALSGGQKQRMLFALALAGDPDIVFLDEPTVGMDIDTRRALWASIRGLAASGKTVLLTTHYLEEADALATRVIVLNKGRVVREGTPSEIKQVEHSRVVRCRTTLSLDQLRMLPGVLAAEEQGGVATLHVRQPEQLLRSLLAADDRLSELEVVAPALEDAFLALTRS